MIFGYYEDRELDITIDSEIAGIYNIKINYSSEFFPDEYTSINKEVKAKNVFCLIEELESMIDSNYNFNKELVDFGRIYDQLKNTFSFIEEVDTKSIIYDTQVEEPLALKMAQLKELLGLKSLIKKLEEKISIQFNGYKMVENYQCINVIDALDKNDISIIESYEEEKRLYSSIISDMKKNDKKR